MNCTVKNVSINVTVQTGKDNLQYNEIVYCISNSLFMITVTHQNSIIKS